MTSRPFERSVAPWLLILVSALVVFTLLPNNRSSILVKELAYCLGGAAFSLLVASAAARGVPLNRAVDWKLASAFLLLMAWMTARHFSGVPSVNGPNIIISLGMLGLTAGAAGLLLDDRGRITVQWGLLAIMALLCVYSMLQWMNVVIFPWDVYLGSGGRVSGSLGNPNLLGGLVAAFMPAAVGILMGSRMGRAAKLSSMAAFTLISVLTISASGTRGSLLGMVAGLVFMALYSSTGTRGGSRRSLVIPLAALAAIVIVGLLMKDRLLELSRLGEGTARVRLVIWGGALKLIAANPFLGYGPGTFQIIFPAVRNPMYSILGTSHNTLHVHCEYLEILVEIGIVGALFFAATFWRLFSSAMDDGSGGRRRLSVRDAGILAGIVAFLGEAFVSVSLRWPPGAFVFALFCGLLLSGGRAGERALPRAVAVLFLLPALFMALWGTERYVTGMRSGHYLFMGKDQYLDRIESELGLAANAAMAWEQTGDEGRRQEALQRFQYAWVCCDSSIAICTRCVEVNPEELGGWYGLGSAWLTKAILYQPANPSLARLTLAAGYPAGRDLSLEATMQALAAYESLRTRASDYAELNNNFALTYTRLGMPDMTMRAMRRAYQLHGHRRADYIHQAVSLAPLGGGFDALHMIWLDKLQGIAASSTTDDRTEPRIESAEWTSGLAMLFHPEVADSLRAALSSTCDELPADIRDRLTSDLADQAAMAATDADLFSRAMACDTTGLLALAEGGLASTDAILPGHIAARAVALALHGDPRGPEGLVDLSVCLLIDGFEWISLWPPDGIVPLQVIAAMPRTGPVPEWRSAFLNTVLGLQDVDMFLMNRIMISRSDFRDNVPPAVLSNLESVWYGTGGMLAARDLDPDSPEPWIPGSAMAAAAELADSIALTGAEGVRTSIAFHFLIASSFWVESQGYTEIQRDFLLARIDTLRTSLDSLLGPEEAMYSMYALFREIEPLLVTRFGEAGNPFVDILEDDIIEGDVRASVM